MKHAHDLSAHPVTDLFVRAAAAGDRIVAGRRGDERGDVPGWVMVTVMTATLVIAIGGLAEDELSTLLSNALSKVSG
jgi:hypothetical protein